MKKYYMIDNAYRRMLALFLILSCFCFYIFKRNVNPVKHEVVDNERSSIARTGGLENSILKKEYDIVIRNNVAQSPNRLHNLRAFYEPGRLMIKDRVAGHNPVDLKLSTIGVFMDGKKIFEPILNATEHSDSNTLVINHSGFKEEFINSSEGIRQSFIIEKAHSESQKLQVKLHVDGMEIEEGRSGELRFTSHNKSFGPAATLTYSDLKCWDANGKILNSTLAHAGSEVILDVDVAGAAFPVTVDPIIQNGNPVNANTKLDGDQNNGRFGSSVQSAGDVNGDGYSDVIIGAMNYDNGVGDEGAAFVYYGSASGLSGSSTKLTQDQAGAFFGSAVSSAGDVNADGYSDVIVASLGYTNGELGEGAFFLFYGSSNGISDKPHQMAESNQAKARMQSVALAGDINDDGFSDVIVGLSGYQNGQANEGAAFVYKGSASGLDLSNPIILESNQINARMGHAVAGAGDVNGDGYQDIVVGAPTYTNGQKDEGAAFVFLGTALGLKIAPVAVLEGNQDNARMGTAVSSTGNSDGDGFSDIAVGAPFYDNGETDEGAVFIFKGVQNGINPVAAQVIEGAVNEVHCGSALAPAGDVNGDGFGDLIVGASNYSEGENGEGIAVVCHGSATGLDNDGSSIIQSDQAQAQMGDAVASAGDVNGDGYSDIIIGIGQYDNAPKSDDGSVLIFHGSPSGISTEATAKVGLTQFGAEFGFSVSSASTLR